MEPIRYMEKTNDEIPFEHRMLGIIRGFDNLAKKLAECRKERNDYRKKYHDLLAWKNPTKDYSKELEGLDTKIKKRQKQLESLERNIADRNTECRNLKGRRDNLKAEVTDLQEQISTIRRLLDI